MEAIISLTFILVVYSIGDFISVKTKSIVSMLFTCSVIFLIGFWIGVPTTLFETSKLQGIGGLLITLLLVHMGTMLNFKQLKEQWKTVVVAIAAIVGIVIALLVIGAPIIGREAAIIAAPPIAGGVIAGIQMADAARAIGNESYAVLATLLVVVQGFVGYPIASFCLKIEAKHVLKKLRSGELASEKSSVQVAEAKPKFFKPVAAKYASENLYLAKAAVVALLATFVSAKTMELVGFNLLDKNILSLLFGILAAETGFLDREVLKEANAFGFAMVALMAVIFSNLSKATPQIVLELLSTIVLSLVIGSVGIIIFSFLAGKILKVSPYLAVAIGASALFGFPGTYIISNEVAVATGENSEEVAAIVDAIMPKMLVAGFITVSIASVVLAGILAPLL
ncbi:hypothetical protein KCG48_08880 [Proteiniclasticum sp. BAD-10]|uniref:Na+/glutamate symporter n=1 Tax=Proteiniclasticum sediminis TaxID=2804028 RepID=A0A941CQM9_9CLOT|nr:hypothetical protein [Proteiniclasticum sediminis]MBR0576452.1 hypothetical protein [Proteiniclasticum sediminis]